MLVMPIVGNARTPYRTEKDTKEAMVASIDRQTIAQIERKYEMVCSTWKVY